MKRHVEAPLIVTMLVVVPFAVFVAAGSGGSSPPVVTRCKDCTPLESVSAPHPLPGFALQRLQQVKAGEVRVVHLTRQPDVVVELCQRLRGLPGRAPKPE